MNNARSSLVYALCLAAGVMMGSGCGRSGTLAPAAEHHGEPFQGAALVPLAQLNTRPDAATGRTVRVSGTIVRQCPSRGCWFVLRDGTGQELRVEMGDYTPELPKRMNYTATVEGQLVPHGSGGYLFVGTGVDFAEPGATRP